MRTRIRAQKNRRHYWTRQFTTFFRIKLAIELIEEASYAVGAIKSSLFFPLIPFAFELLVIAWFTAVALFLASSGRQQYMVNTEECPNAKGGQKWVKGRQLGWRGQRSSRFPLFSCLTEQSESSLECVMVDNNVAVPDSLDCPAGTTCEFFKYGNPTKANYLQVGQSVLHHESCSPN